MLLQEILDRHPRVSAQFFDGRAFAADDDGLLRGSLHIEGRGDANEVGLLLVALHDNFHTVGNLLLVLQQDLLADEFRHEEAHRAVGEGILREIGRALGQQRDDAFAHLLDVDPLEGGNGENIRGRENRLPVALRFLHLLIGVFVDFVDDEHHGDAHLVDLFDELLVVSGLPALDEIEDDVGVLQRVGDKLHHVLLHHVGGIEHARQVGIDNLVVVAVDDALDSVPGSLRLGGHDGDLLADQLVHEGAFAHVGVADDVDEARTVRGIIVGVFHIRSFYRALAPAGAAQEKLLLRMQDRLAVARPEGDVAEMRQPVSRIEERAIRGEFVAHGHMPVREDEVVDGGCGDQPAGELHLVLVLALELQHAFVVGITAALGTISRNGKRVARMQHAVQPLVNWTVEDSLDEQVLALPAAQTVAVPHKTAATVDLHQLRFAIDARPERAGEIVLHPHVVVARKVVDFNPLTVQLLQEGEQGDIAPRRHIAVFEPEVEDVA